MARIERHLPRLTNVTTVQPETGGEILQAKVDWDVEPEWDLLVKPPRLQVRLPDVECGIPERQLPMAGEFVDRVEIGRSASELATELTIYLRELIKFDAGRSPDGGFQVSFRRERLQGKRIVLDAGHGGRDSGARGEVLLEKDVNLDVARRTAQLLRSRGALARLTRDSDEYIDLFTRPELANDCKADLFVSIHCNAMPRRNEGHGIETFYYRDDSKCLAYLLQDCLVSGLRRYDRGVKQARFVVIRKTSMPSALVELMFLNHDTEEALLQQSAVRDTAAGAVAEGVRRYFEGSGRPPVAPERGAGLTRTG